MKSTEVKIKLENVKKKKKKKNKGKKEKEHLGLLFIFDLNFEQSKIKTKSREKKYQVIVESAAECIDCRLTTSGLRALTGETTAQPSLSFCAGNYLADRPLSRIAQTKDFARLTSHSVRG